MTAAGVRCERGILTAGRQGERPQGIVVGQRPTFLTDRDSSVSSRSVPVPVQLNFPPHTRGDSDLTLASPFPGVTSWLSRACGLGAGPRSGQAVSLCVGPWGVEDWAGEPRRWPQFGHMVSDLI